MKRLSVFLFFWFSLTSVWAQTDQWWNPKWKARREVEVRAVPPKYEGDEVGYVEFWTAGNLKPDGSDLRVVAEGALTPYKIIQIGPGDYCKLSFRLARNAATYYIYYGNPSAPEEKQDWEPKRGLLLEIRRYRGPGFQTWDQMKESLDQAKSSVMGRQYVPNVFHGYNPFGETVNYLSLYTGWLAIPSAGDYVFATTSDDASFLFIDDNLVVSWEGSHRAMPYAARFEIVRGMTPGLHKFAYYHAQALDAAAAVAAWLPAARIRTLPGSTLGQRTEWMQHNPFEVIPPAAFPAVTKGVLRDYRVRGAKLAADFDVENVGEVQVGDQYVQRIKFTDRTPSVKGFTATNQKWDFGDGNIGIGSPVEHVYLGDGDFKVTLEVSTTSHRFPVTQTVHVTRDWKRQMYPSTDTSESYASVISQYDFAAMPAEHLCAAARLFDELGRKEKVVELCKEVLAGERKEVPQETAFDMAMLLAKSLSDAETTRWAVDALRAVEAKSRDMRQQAALALAAGEIALERLRDPALAEEQFQRVATKYASADRDALRHALVGLGDVYSEKGDYAKVKECLDKAAEISTARRDYREAAVQIGAYSRAVEMYLRENHLDQAEDFLNAWEWEHPAERLRGHSTLLRARLLVARDDPRSAAHILERLVLVNPRSPYAAECLLLAAECYQKLGDNKRAVAILRQIVNEQKDSPLRPEAAKRLKALE